MINISSISPENYQIPVKDWKTKIIDAHPDQFGDVAIAGGAKKLEKGDEAPFDGVLVEPATADEAGITVEEYKQVLSRMRILAGIRQ